MYFVQAVDTGSQVCEPGKTKLYLTVSYKLYCVCVCNFLADVVLFMLLFTQHIVIRVVMHDFNSKQQSARGNFLPQHGETLLN